MQTNRPNLRPVALLLAVLLLPTVLLAGQNDHHRTAAGSTTGHHGNALLDEMLLLDRVFREVVSAVALEDAKRVHTALEAMHGTMEKTHEGVHAGTVKIPRNADRLEEFVRMDRDFHGNLEQLADAAHRDDRQAMAVLTKNLLDGCVGCHRVFRNP